MSIEISLFSTSEIVLEFYKVVWELTISRTKIYFNIIRNTLTKFKIYQKLKNNFFRVLQSSGQWRLHRTDLNLRHNSKFKII